MIVKCGRREFTISNHDEIMFNGGCYQITTQSYLQGFTKLTPVIAKTKAEKLIKDGTLVLSRTEKSKYIKDELKYYILKGE